MHRANKEKVSAWALAAAQLRWLRQHLWRLPTQRQHLPLAARALHWLLLLLCPLVLFGGAAYHLLADPARTSQALSHQGIDEAFTDAFLHAATAELVATHSPYADPTIVTQLDLLLAATFNPDWLHLNLGRVLREALPHFTGQRPTLHLHLTLADRVDALATATLRLPAGRRLLLRLYLLATDLLAQRIANLPRTLPYGIEVDAETWRTALRTALPPAWLIQVMDDHIPVLRAYVAGENVQPSLHIPLAERRRDVAAALEIIVLQSNTLAFLQRDIIGPALDTAVDDHCLVPEAGLVLPKEDIIAAFQVALTSRWVQERQKDIVASVVDYVVGISPTVTLQIPLVPLKEMATQHLVQRLEDLLDSHFASLPRCPLGHFPPMDPLPWCRPLGLGYHTLALFGGPDLTPAVRAVLDQRLPDLWLYSESPGPEHLGPSHWLHIQQMRSWMQFGLYLKIRDAEALVSIESQRLIQRSIESIRAGIHLHGDAVKWQLFHAHGRIDLPRPHRMIRLLTYLHGLGPALLIAFAILSLVLMLCCRSLRAAIAWTSATYFWGALIALVATYPMAWLNPSDAIFLPVDAVPALRGPLMALLNAIPHALVRQGLEDTRTLALSLGGLALAMRLTLTLPYLRRLASLRSRLSHAHARQR